MKTTLTTPTPTRTPATSVAAARLNAAVDTPDPAVLDRLRRAAKPTKSAVSLAQATVIVDGVLAGTGRDAICAATGLDPDAVLDVVASFGTRMRHTRPGPAFTLVKAAGVDPANPPTPAAGTILVVVPAGFERAGSGRRRDVTQALGSLVASNPTSDEVADWVARQRQASATVLEFSVVTAVHTFARFGRLDEVDEINAESPELAGTLAAAIDLLLGGLRSGLSGMLAIVNGATGVELDEAIAAARPLAEGRIDRVAVAAKSGDVALERARKALAAHLADPATVVPAKLADLEAGQVLRIAQAAGLGHVETNRTDETAIRARLGEMGLASATESLVPAAVRAIRAGLEDAFWASMELRADGEEEWDEPLRRAAAAATSAAG